MEQISFMEYERSLEGQTKTGIFLEGVKELIPWEELERKCVEAGVYKRRAEEPGRPMYPFRVLLGSLFLQVWYKLSDPQTEEQIKDRYSFRSFLGIGYGAEARVPDETTLCRFRNRLVEAGLMEYIFDAVREELEKRDLILKEGQIVDATIVSSPRPKRVKEVEQGEKKVVVYDSEASYTVKRGQISYGFKIHIQTDKQGIVKRVKTTSASVHDVRVVSELVDSGGGPLYGDSGYMSEGVREMCERMGVGYEVIERRVRGEKELREEVRERNVERSKVRGVVELPFAIIKYCFGYVRSRFRGLEKNGAYHYLLLAGYNLKRMWGMLRKGGGGEECVGMVNG